MKKHYLLLVLLLAAAPSHADIKKVHFPDLPKSLNMEEAVILDKYFPSKVHYEYATDDNGEINYDKVEYVCNQPKEVGVGEECVSFRINKKVGNTVYGTFYHIFVDGGGASPGSVSFFYQKGNNKPIVSKKFTLGRMGYPPKAQLVKVSQSQYGWVTYNRETYQGHEYGEIRAYIPIKSRIKKVYQLETYFNNNNIKDKRNTKSWTIYGMKSSKRKYYDLLLRKQNGSKKIYTAKYSTAKGKYVLSR